jgi:hypothetical protein
MMTAFTSWMMMTFMAFMQPAISRPMPDFVVTEYDVVVPVYKPIETINCSQCIHIMDTAKNDSVILEHVARDVEDICSRIYGPAAHECVNVTHAIESGLAYLESHNSTDLCHHLHYC